MLKPLFLTTVLVVAGSANATVLFSEDFDSITANTLNIGPGNAVTTAASMYVVGEVDAVVPTNPFGITGLTSTVIDLDGTPGPGLVGKSGLNFISGRTYSLAFVVGGAQRGSASDGLFIRLLSDVDGDLSILGGDGWSVPFPNINNIGSNFSISTVILGNSPFDIRSLTILANSDTSFGFEIGTDSRDNIGPLLDSVALREVRGVIPEPATWAMLIAGFGLVGTAMRRRRAIAA